ncbi:jg26228 [Pararge aegeria aegeria]|uniref:Jg26228 protein n=1 Tax=Pararge aegeria aegeria TaxID=348720 RepID=A0A8S4RWA0_9NEOP|nr:jg26228 [Pararge aegeria aegeria]
MSSLQERLQLKRSPLDTWNIREQLCLASAVVRSGDQNWMSVSRALKTIGEANRPPDWYSQKSCAAQYGALLEHVETPKRKKRNSEGGVETPQESILKSLTQQRIQEIQNNLTEMNAQYEQIKNEILEVRNPATPDEKIQEFWANIEAGKRAKERESARRAAWLKEREERRSRTERTWRPTQTQPPSTGAPTTPSSPLLTSLLKSSPVVTTPQHIPHPASIVDAVSPSATAPTLSLLLEQTGHAQESKHAAIEHIKSQLVQIEHQLKANSQTQPSVDIDDIEIKAEDVYAFRDVDIHIPPVTAMHKTPVRVTEKPAQKKEMEISIPETEVSEIPLDAIKEEPVSEEPINEELHHVASDEMEVVEDTAVEETPLEELQPQKEPEVKISFPEVKFPTPEIKIIHPEEPKMQIKEEIKEPDVARVEEENVVQKEVHEEEKLEETPIPPKDDNAPEETIPVEEQPKIEEETVESAEQPQPQAPQPQPQPQPQIETQPEPEETSITTEIPDPQDIPLPPDIEPTLKELVVLEEIQLPPNPEEPATKEVDVSEDKIEEPITQENKELEKIEESTEEKVLEVIKKEDDAERGYYTIDEFLNDKVAWKHPAPLSALTR